MIQVQIASEVTTQGIEGVRWVLLEHADAGPVMAPPQGAANDPADPAMGPSVHTPVDRPANPPMAMPPDPVADRRTDAPTQAAVGQATVAVQPTSQPTSAEPPGDAAQAERSQLLLGVLKLAVMGIGLVVALGWAQSRFGAPSLRWQDSKPAPGSAKAAEAAASGLLPVARPPAPASAPAAQSAQPGASAPATESLVTAEAR